jgi:hypothetical protein
MTKSKSPRKLIDAYADAALRLREIQATLDELRPQVVALGEGLHVGREHALVVNQTQRASLSTTLCKALLTPAEILTATVVSDVTTVKVER